MNLLYITMICVGGGPFSSAINLNAPVPPKPDANWQTVAVDSTTIELPIPIAKTYTQTAPANYKVPTPTKRVPLYCPMHGYSCGMTQAAEDLLGHLQSVHNITLEQANELGRDKWQQLHNDIHWGLETEARKELFLNPVVVQPEVVQPIIQPPVVQPVIKRSGCKNGNCPTYSPGGRFFR
jgi:hypothetical protein